MVKSTENGPTEGAVSAADVGISVSPPAEVADGQRQSPEPKPAGGAAKGNGNGHAGDAETPPDQKQWPDQGPEVFKSDSDDEGPIDCPSLGATQTLSRVVSRGKFGHQPVTAYVVIVCLVAACGGLLFGYSLAVTAGVAAMGPFVERFFPDPLQSSIAPPPPPLAPGGDGNVVSYCPEGNLNGIGFYTSSLFLAGAVASPFTYWSSNHLGRKGSILIAGCTYLAGGLLQTFAVHVAMLYAGRILTGIGISFANQSIPVFLSEMSPPKLRGALSMGFQFAVTLGILASQLLTYLVNRAYPDSDLGWRIALGLATIPAVIVVLGGMFLPDTPNSLIARGFEERGKQVLERIRGTPNVAIEFMDICEAASQGAEGAEPGWKAILRRDHRPQLIIAIIVPIIQQLTGANAVLFYAPLIFQATGADTQSALLSNVILGGTNVAATIIAVIVVDRLGRKPLLMEGLAQMLAAMVVMAVAFALANEGDLSQGLSIVLLAMMLVFFTGYAWSWAGLAWVIPNEVQPLDTRSTGQAVAVCANFLATFAVGQSFPVMLCAMEWGVYLFYGAWCLLGLVFTVLFIPETKGLGIEDIYYLFTGHWFWGSFFTEDQKRNVVLEPAHAASLEIPGGHLSVYLSRTLQRQWSSNSHGT